MYMCIQKLSAIWSGEFFTNVSNLPNKWEPSPTSERPIVLRKTHINVYRLGGLIRVISKIIWNNIIIPAAATHISETYEYEHNMNSFKNIIVKGIHCVVFQ